MFAREALNVAFTTLAKPEQTLLDILPTAIVKQFDHLNRGHLTGNGVMFS